jgi:DNA polymerase III epsilon subunit-like protein
MGQIDPEAIKVHGIRPADLKNAPRFPTILTKVKDFVGDSPIVAHAYKNERDFLDYEFARAKVIQWGESAYAEERTFARRSCLHSFSLGPLVPLPRCAIGWRSTAARGTTDTAHCLTPT